MKKLLAVFAIGLMIVMTMPQADAAKRFGGGSSFGRQAPVPALSQKAPAANPAQNFNRQQANPAAGAAAAAKPASPWKGMLMGAAAALGIAALASALGLGEGMVQILMMILLAVVLYFVFRFAMGFFLAKKMRAAGAQGAGAAAQRPEETILSRMSSAAQTAQQTPAQQPAPAPAAAASAAAAGATPGSVMDTFATTAAVANGELSIPEGFDTASFEKVAKENFAKLQKAWDTGNVVEISDFTTNDLFIAVTHQLRERGNTNQTSEIVDLTAKLLGIATEQNDYVAVVEFTGAMKFDGEFETVHERWILTRPLNETEGWLLAGIEQVQDPVPAA